MAIGALCRVLYFCTPKNEFGNDTKCGEIIKTIHYQSEKIDLILSIIVIGIALLGMYNVIPNMGNVPLPLLYSGGTIAGVLVLNFIAEGIHKAKTNCCKKEQINEFIREGYSRDEYPEYIILKSE